MVVLTEGSPGKGPDQGYRVHFQQRGPIVIVLLSGGDKDTQAADIRRAIAIAGNWSA